MDHLHERLDALEQQVYTLTQHTHTATRRLRWWRGLACSVIALALLTWALPAGTGEQQGLAQRVAALEDLLKHFSREKNEVFITGANLHIRNGLGSTDCFDEQLNEIPDCPNALGNLIVGYNEPRVVEPDVRTGSHNVVVGEGHSFSRFGGIVVGRFNTISGVIAAVIGGEFNTASGGAAAVIGGFDNRASGEISVVSGGVSNTASEFAAAVSGGQFNTASGFAAAVSGGASNTASGFAAAVSGGASNTASGNLASVSGGGFNPFTEEGVGNMASGDLSSVSGGSGNTARGEFSSVSGGRNITQETALGWSAGSEADEVVVGNFRSP